MAEKLIALCLSWYLGCLFWGTLLPSLKVTWSPNWGKLCFVKSGILPAMLSLGVIVIGGNYWKEGQGLLLAIIGLTGSLSWSIIGSRAPRHHRAMAWLFASMLGLQSYVIYITSMIEGYPRHKLSGGYLENALAMGLVLLAFVMMGIGCRKGLTYLAVMNLLLAWCLVLKNHSYALS